MSSRPAPSCPVCGGKEAAFYETVPFKGTTYALHRCGDCSSIFAIDPPRTDYSSHTAEENSIRDYVELNAAVDIIAANVLSAIASRRPGRLLDIGCGYGFGADTARRLAGWQVTGVEPSPYGRRGARALGITIGADIVTADHPLARERFDAIFSSEVIEHVDDPRAFVALARSMLADGGILVLGTPDAAALDEAIPAAERLAVVSPGAHLFLLSREALERLLAEAGFAHVEIRRRGTSLVACASDRPVVLTDPDPIAVGRAYANAVLASGPLDAELRSGMVFRAFRFAIDLNDYGAALGMEPLLPEVRIDGAGLPADYAAFMAAFPSHVGPLTYYRAMLHLNYTRDYGRAADLFALAWLLCKSKVAAAPANSVVESSMLWGCLYHQALAQRASGDGESARATWARLLRPGPPGLPEIAPSWAARAEARLAE